MKSIQPDVKKKKRTKHTRLPNGFGSVTFLKGNRRNPYWAKKTVGFDPETGYPIVKTIGYYSEWLEAFQALCEYNKSPYDLDNATLTFQEVYDKWSKRKFSEVKNGKTLSKQSISSYNASFKHCKELYKLKFREINTMHLQAVIDHCPKGRATLENIVNLFIQLYKYAEEFDICEKNYASYVIITKQDNVSTKRAIPDEEIHKILVHKGNYIADFILVLLYTGMRISELNTIRKENVYIEKRYMIGGSKTEAGKDRIIPIHHAIIDIIEEKMKSNGDLLFGDYSISYIREKQFYPFMEAMNLDYTPHECRHTFITKADKVNMNDVALHKIVGHSVTGITKKIYTHKDINNLLIEIEKIEY